MKTITFTIHWDAQMGEAMNWEYINGQLRQMAEAHGALRLYIQTERQLGIHTHVVIQLQDGYAARGFMQRTHNWLSREYQKYNHAVPPGGRCAVLFDKTIQVLRNRNGTYRDINGEQYITKYLKDPEKQDKVIDSMNSGYEARGPNEGPVERMEELDEDGLTSRGEKIERLINKLSEKGITTREEWREWDPHTYINTLTGNQGAHMIRTVLEETKERQKHENIGQIAKRTHERLPDRQGRENVIYQLMSQNGYRKRHVAQIFWSWANHQSGKRNALVLEGPPDTGKSIITGAFQQLTNNYGMVNKNNESFPFTNCDGKSLIIMEEGILTEKIIEDWKAITAGQMVKIDKKQKSDQAVIARTPLLWTTNSEPYKVKDGSSITMKHREALQSRYLLFKMIKKAKDIPNWQYPTDMQKLIDLCEVMSDGSKLPPWGDQPVSRQGPLSLTLNSLFHQVSHGIQGKEKLGKGGSCQQGEKSSR